MGPLVRVRPLRREEKTLWSSHAAHAWNDAGCGLVVIDEFPSTLTVCDEVEARARLVLGLRHPNVATVREVARDDASCKVVSDWVEGERLDALRAAGPLEAEMALRIVIDVLTGLGGLHDHDARVVHGHVEPANVIVGRDGVARLVRPYLGPGRLVVIEAGALHRVAPEVLKQADVDRRADVYGVGVLLKELLPESLPEWGARLSDVVATALAADPSRRFPTTADMARALRLVASSHVSTHATIAVRVDWAAGERIDARRVELAPPAERPAEPAAPKPPLLPTMRIAARPVVQAASQTTRMLRVSLQRVSRMWAATLGVTMVLAATLVWIGVRPSSATARAAPPPPPAVTIPSQPPAPPAPSLTPVREIEIVETPAPAVRAERPRPRPQKPIDRSAVF